MGNHIAFGMGEVVGHATKPLGFVVNSTVKAAANRPAGELDMADAPQRVALLGLFHETNTFSAIPADVQNFNAFRGEAILTGAAGSQSVIAGYMAGLEHDPQVELVPLMRASSTKGSPRQSPPTT